MGCVSGLFVLGAGQVVGSLLRPTITAYAAGPIRTVGNASLGSELFKVGGLGEKVSCEATRKSKAVSKRRPTPLRTSRGAQKGAFDRAVLANLQVVFRQTSPSGLPKIEVIDWGQKFLEKITFK